MIVRVKKADGNQGFHASSFTPHTHPSFKSPCLQFDCAADVVVLLMLLRLPRLQLRRFYCCLFAVGERRSVATGAAASVC